MTDLSLVNGHHSKSSTAQQPKRHATPIKSRYGTRTTTGAVRRRRYHHPESDDDRSPRSGRRTPRKNAPCRREEEDEEEMRGSSSSSSSDRSDKSDKENNEESDSGTEEYSAEEFAKPTPTPTKSMRHSTTVSPTKRGSDKGSKRPARSSEEYLVETRNKRRTRNRGRRTVTYEEDSEDGAAEEPNVSVSSRGRIRKISARVRGALLGD